MGCQLDLRKTKVSHTAVKHVQVTKVTVGHLTPIRTLGTRLRGGSSGSEYSANVATS